MLFLKYIRIGNNKFSSMCLPNSSIGVNGDYPYLGLSDGSERVVLYAEELINCKIIGVKYSMTGLMLAPYSDVEIELYKLLGSNFSGSVFNTVSGVMNIFQAAKYGYISLRGSNEFNSLFAKYCMMG